MKTIVVFKSGTEVELDLPLTEADATDDTFEVRVTRPFKERRYFLGRDHGGPTDPNIATCTWNGERRAEIPVLRERIDPT